MMSARPPLPVPAGWEGLLDQDETILWQGRPDTGIAVLPGQLFEICFGLFFTGFSMYWMVIASQAGGVFWMFGLFFFAGLGIITRSNLLAAQRRHFNHCTLTSKRAVIATNVSLFWRSLKFYLITANSLLELNEQGAFGKIIFLRLAPPEADGGTNRQNFGFKRISKAQEIYAMMRKVQTNNTKAKGERDA
jgi:hypothetical protein